MKPIRDYDWFLDVEQEEVLPSLTPELEVKFETWFGIYSYMQDLNNRIDRAKNTIEDIESVYWGMTAYETDYDPKIVNVLEDLVRNDLTKLRNKRDDYENNLAELTEELRRETDYVWYLFAKVGELQL